MNALLDAQRGALGAMQRACAAQPGLHAHQLAALARELALCQAAHDLADYQRRSGGGLELARAAWLDRVAGRLRVAASMGDTLGATAWLTEYRGALRATGLDAWPATLVAAAQAAAPAHQRAAVAGSSLTRTLVNLVLHHTSTPPTADHRADALGAWQALCAADPVAARAVQQGGALPLRVALRLPWRDQPQPLPAALLALLPEPDHHPAPDDAAAEGEGGHGRQEFVPGHARAEADPAADPAAVQAALCAEWQRALLQRSDGRDGGSGGGTGGGEDGGAGDGHRGSGSGNAWSAADTSAEQALQPWIQLSRPAPGASAPALAVARVAARMLAAAAGAANGPEVQRRLAESGLTAALAAAPLLARLDEIESHQAAWPQPLLAAHARALRAGLHGARTATEVELRAAHADACLGVEADWQRLLFAVALAPLRAAVGVAIEGAAARPGLLAADSLAQGLMGMGAQQLLATPGLHGFVEGTLGHRVVPAGVEPDAHAHAAADTGGVDVGGAQAWHAEAGHEMLPWLRAWGAVAAARGVPVDLRPAGLANALRALLSRSLPGGTVPAPAVLQLWGERQPVAGWAQLLQALARPPLPGLVAEDDAARAV